MGLFDKALKAAKNVGNGIANSAAAVGSSAGVMMQDNSETANLKMQINVIERELDSAYGQIGRKYVQYLLDTGDTGNIDVADLLKMMEPKIIRKQELEQELNELEKRMRQNAILREKERVEQEFLDEKKKLDRALAMDIVSQDEYDFKLGIARKRVDNFEEIRRVEQQLDMGIITKEEKNARIDALLK